jgi:hypothetical protein
VEDNAERIAAYRQEAINLDNILRRVETRGGPQPRWAVSLPECESTLGRIHVSFYKLQNGGFSLSVYSRRDGVHPDLQRDWPLIEDAVFCIAQEFEKHGRRAGALKPVADAIRSKSDVGQRGPRLLDPVERADRQKAIEAQAGRIDALGEGAAEGQPTTYREFNAILTELSNLGYSPPPPSLVSAVARNYVDHRARVRILLVRSGTHDAPVTKAIEADQTQANQLVAGHHLKYLGTRLPPIGQISRLASFTGSQHVGLEVSPGANVTGAREPCLYLVLDMAPERVIGRDSSSLHGFISGRGSGRADISSKTQDLVGDGLAVKHSIKRSDRAAN